METKTGSKMKHWFYAVIVEQAGHYSTAIQAVNEMAARATLRLMYPHGKIHSLECE